MKKNSILFIIISVFSAACTTARKNPDDTRQPASRSEFQTLVTIAEANTYCDQTGAGGACLVTWMKADEYCRRNGMHLPTAQEYATYLTKYGVQTLSVEQFKASGLKELNPIEIVGLPRKDGFYKVSCEPKSDGIDQSFYMNDYRYTRPAGIPGNHGIWTASSPPGHPEAAHVVYDQWGGGGGKPKDHVKRALNAFRCVR